MSTPVLDLAQELIRRPSVTPADAGCQTLLAQRLTAIGFTCETLASGEVLNLWARRGARAPLVVCAGHTDVVPAGPLERWRHAPYTPVIEDGKLYGRGAADMKSSLAAFVVAMEEVVAAHPTHPGSIALLLTSDEEGPATDGTIKVCEALSARGIAPDYCIVGEPTSVERLGDTIKNGRRGSLSGHLKIHGIQGHVAYPHLARNPVHQCAPAIAELARMDWDAGNAYFPPTTFQISNFQAGAGATNVIPGTAEIDFNFRFATASTPESLRTRVHAVLDAHGLDYALHWRLNGSPFLTPPGALSDALAAAIHGELGVTTELSTTGGTSDGRFLARICPQVVEFGPINATIHQVDEHIAVDTLEPLKNIYRRTLETLLGIPSA